MSQGEYTAAEKLYERSLAIQEAALGPEHPDVAVWFNNRAELLHDQVTVLHRVSVACYSLLEAYDSVNTTLDMLSTSFRTWRKKISWQKSGGELAARS